jgi:hypothetical protein
MPKTLETVTNLPLNTVRNLGRKSIKKTHKERRKNWDIRAI